MAAIDKAGVAAAGEEILRYLRTHPMAADSLEGIVEWWLPPSGPHHTEAVIQQALDCLAERGLIVRTVLVDGTVLYAGAVREEQPH